MQIVIVHYHLNPGGVTGIIGDQITALQRHCPEVPITLAVGNASGRSYPGVTIKEIPELNYLPENADLDADFAVIDGFFRDLPPQTVVHIHNLNLGKNPLLTLASYLAVKRGTAVVNHCHDFSEDRAENFRRMEKIITGHFAYRLHAVMYPAFSNCHFAAINRSDCQRLHQVLSPLRVDYLPNPAPEVAPLADRTAVVRRLRRELEIPEGHQLLVYPVRPIRRKNIGEFILICELLKERVVGAITLTPLNPAEQESYREWEDFVGANALPVRFRLGEKYELPEIMAAADSCLTTSVREGFGMAFIEPWLYGKPVAGRRLADNIGDFAEFGIEFPCLYDRINLPDEERDFAELSVKEQMDHIRRISRDRRLAETMQELNPSLVGIAEPVAQERIRANADAIRSNLSIANYGKRLYEIYLRIIGDHAPA